MRLTTKNVALCDLDGTLANTQNRRHLDPLKNSSSSWSQYAQACLTDMPITTTLELVKLYYPDYLIFLISGRDDSSYDQTQAWLRLYGVSYDRLTLRAQGDERSNVDIKTAYALSVIQEGFNPVVLIDDLQDVCEAVAAVGVPTLQVRALGLSPEPEAASYSAFGPTYA